MVGYGADDECVGARHRESIIKGSQAVKNQPEGKGYNNNGR